MCNRNVTKIVNGKTLIATIDIGKGSNTGYYRCPDGTDIKPFSFANNREGFDCFWKRIEQARKDHGLEEIVVGFESTGAYGEPLHHYLLEKPVRLVQVNPMHTKRVKELTDNSPNKTDDKDPKVIADIIALGRALTVVIPEGAAAELRRLTNARERSSHRRTTLVNQLESIVWIVFPEFCQIMKTLTSASAKYLLEMYPLPQAMAALDLSTLTTELKKVSRGKLGAERAQALFQAAHQSVGVRDGSTSVAWEIKKLLALMATEEEMIESAEQEMAAYLAQIPYSQSILSVKGIGIVTAAGLVGEVGDFRRYATLGEVIKLAGLDLYEVSSGQHKGERHITKRGRSHLRKLLYFAALGAVRTGGVMHHRYQQYIQRGMLKPKALVIIAKKLLTLVFALVRDDRRYQADYVNQQVSPLKKAA